MNTRRKFLLQGTLAATALLISDPFKSLANTLNPVMGYSINGNKLVLVHTGNLINGFQHQTITQVKAIKRKTGNILHVHTGNQDEFGSAQLNYDVSLHTGPGDKLTNQDYRIIYKGDIKIGIIKAIAGEKDTKKRINTLAALLKKEKKCQVVICLSELGYKNKTTVDDMKLARSSAYIDVIISGHPHNFSARPYIAHNSKQEEVIIQCADANNMALSNIEIGFDKMLNKQSVLFNNFNTSVSGKS